MKPQILIPDATRKALSAYRCALVEGNAIPGKRVLSNLEAVDEETLTGAALLSALLQSKKPLIFAESAVAGDGSDWNAIELQLLSDVSVAMDVTIFDDGWHSSPEVHSQPFEGTLIFTPGALLRASGRSIPADWEEVVRDDGTLDDDAYDALYLRRLLPAFQHIEAHGKASGRPGLLTIPGLGCGQFAGRFHGQLGAALERALVNFLERHGADFPHLKAVYYDPYSECRPSRREIHGIPFLVRPLLDASGGKPQLCAPPAYQEAGDDFSNCRLFSIVAWDHVSWPGNDFFGGSRATDDGVKAAATNSMEVLTGVAGSYSAERSAYLPPPPFGTWTEVIAEKRIPFPL